MADVPYAESDDIFLQKGMRNQKGKHAGLGRMARPALDGLPSIQEGFFQSNDYYYMPAEPTIGISREIDCFGVTSIILKNSTNHKGEYETMAQMHFDSEFATLSDTTH